MTKIDRKAYKIIIDYAKSNLEKINVMPGTCRYNFRCQMNAVNDAIVSKQNKIAMCIYIDDGQPIIHFLNVTNDLTFFDNTLGVWCQEYEYYLVKFINEPDFFKVNSIFSAFRRELFRKLPFLIRNLSCVTF